MNALKKPPHFSHPKSILEDLAYLKLEFEELAQAPSCEGFERSVFAKVYPRDQSEVLQILELARKFKCALYPVSTGKNWGFGTQVPTEDNLLIVDLQFLNSISSYDTHFGTLKIEPGVTQKQLSRFLLLHGATHQVDVTGSGEDTSVLGNTLERGVGYRALRHTRLLSLKILLADGTIVQSGYERFGRSHLGKCLSTGVGPSLNDIFTQSNFGIVLEATLQLRKKSEYVAVFLYFLNDDEALVKNSQIIRELFEEEVISCIPKVADQKRCEIVFCPKYYEKAKAEGRICSREEVTDAFKQVWGSRKWNVMGSVSGPRSLVNAKLERIRVKLEGLAKLRIVDEASLAGPDTLQSDFDRMVYGYSTGVPSNEALRSIYWDFCEEDKAFNRPESKDYGFVYMAPLVANSPEEIKKFIQTYQRVSVEFKVPIAATLNFINPNTIEVVLSFSFNKNNSFDLEQAQHMRESLQQSFLVEGFLPYRLDVASMETFLEITSFEQKAWNELCRKIKIALDPEYLIAPGRYVAR